MREEVVGDQTVLGSGGCVRIKFVGWSCNCRSQAGWVWHSFGFLFLGFWSGLPRRSLLVHGWEAWVRQSDLALLMVL